MKQLFCISILVLFCACTGRVPENSPTSNPNGKAKFVIQEEIHNFGTVQAGEMVSYSFKFSNTGNADLQITNVEADCGCLHVDYPEEAVKPGESSYIEVLFNTAGEVGQVLKQITVQTNDGGKSKQLIVTAKVENELFKSYN